MTDFNISTKVTDKPYSINGVEATYIDAIDCPLCKSAVIAELEAVLGRVTLYDFDPYYLSNQKIPHRHPADARTRNRVLKRIEVEKRLLHNVDPGDYHYWGRNENVR
jgi:hypothetical protein